MGDTPYQAGKESKLDVRERDTARMSLFCQSINDGLSWDASVRKAFGNQGTMYRAMQADNRLRVDYELAMVARADQFAHEIIDIADSGADAQLSRNRIDARKWLASKLYPKRYGERLELAVTQEISINDALSEARSRLRPVSDPAPIIDAQVIDIPGICDGDTSDSKSEVPGPDVDIFS